MQIALRKGRTPQNGVQTESKHKKRRLPKKKTLVFVTLGLITLAILGIVVWKLFYTTAEAAVLTGKTTYGSLATTLDGTAITMPADSYTYTTASDTEILEVAVSSGDTVQKGDLLFVQDDSEVDDAIDDYQDQIDDYEDQITGYQDQKSDLLEEMAEVNIKSPISGRVQDVQLEVGDTVKMGDTLCTIVDDSEMNLTQYFSYAYEDQISQGMAAVLSVPDLMTSLNGTVTDIRKVERVTGEGTKCFAVTVTVENPGALTEGMAAGGYLLDGAEKLYPAVEGSLENQGTKTVTAKCSGELLSLKVGDYEKVTAGQTLFVLDDSDYQTQLKNYNDQMTRAQERITSLQERIAEAEESRADYRVTSDIDGRVVMVRISAGNTPTKGSTVVAVYDLTKMSISASIDELDIEYITMGMPVKIIRSGAETDTEYEGIVTEVAMEATSSGGVATFPVTIEIESGGALSAGVNVSYYISVGDETGEGVLAPVAAVQYTDEGTCLFVKADAQPENAIDLEGAEVPEGFYPLPVEVGTSSGRQVRILSGVERDVTVFVGYEQTAPSGGATTSEGQGTQTDQTGMSSDFSGGFPGGGYPGGGTGGGMSRPMG